MSVWSFIREAVKPPSRQELGVEGVQRRSVGSQRFIRYIDQRLINETKIFGQRGFCCVKVEQSGDVLLSCFRLVKGREGRHSVGRVVFIGNGFQTDG